MQTGNPGTGEGTGVWVTSEDGEAEVDRGVWGGCGRGLELLITWIATAIQKEAQAAGQGFWLLLFHTLGFGVFITKTDIGNLFLIGWIGRLNVTICVKHQEQCLEQRKS